MPPQIRGFGTGPGQAAPFHQSGFPPHVQPPGGPMNGNQFLNVNAQLNPFATSNSNSFGPVGLNAAANTAFADAGFGSQSARIGFNHGPASATLQQSSQSQHQNPHQHQHQHHHLNYQHQQAPQSHNTLVEQPTLRNQPNKGRIREVWRQNLHEEMALLGDLVDKYPYIAMDTEFPGIVARPMGAFRGKSDYHYQCLRVNVDLLKVIQIGLTLFNEDGETPPARPSPHEMTATANRRSANQGPSPCTWQFNFKFSIKDDMYSEKSIESLQQAGIDFNLLEHDGIDPHDFATLLIPSGLVCIPEVRWISFHGGYDFGYLTKLLSCLPLPNEGSEFDERMKLYFPSTFDVKHLMKHAIRLHSSGLLAPTDPAAADILHKFEHKSGLENIAETFKIKRTGSAHQAGSDSLLTGKVFFQMRDKIFNGTIPEEHLGRIWGLNIPDISLSTGSMLNTASSALMAGGDIGGGLTGVGGGGGNPSNVSNVVSSSGNEISHNDPPPVAPAGSNNAGAPSTPNAGSVGLVSTPDTQGNQTTSLHSIISANSSSNNINNIDSNSNINNNNNNENNHSGSSSSANNNVANAAAANAAITNPSSLPLQHVGPMTPGGGGGVFGSFAFPGSGR